MNLFLDTNILVDVVANRLPFSKWAIRIFKEAKKGRFQLFTSSFSILTCYYIIERDQGRKQAKRVIQVLMNRLKTQEVTHKELLTALALKIEDYEDAVQYECAMLCKEIDVLVTRNKKDFKHSAIAVKSPEELFLEEF